MGFIVIPSLHTSAKFTLNSLYSSTVSRTGALQSLLLRHHCCPRLASFSIQPEGLEGRRKCVTWSFPLAVAADAASTVSFQHIVQSKAIFFTLKNKSCIVSFKSYTTRVNNDTRFRRFRKDEKSYLYEYVLNVNCTKLCSDQSSLFKVANKKILSLKDSKGACSKRKLFWIAV